jgi:uncharacterized protein (UPF0264 family)
MPQLLVSVRNAAEASVALEAGADLIDVKEPARGPLGRADDNVIRAVVQWVAGRLPVSAALGELSPHPLKVAGVQYVKWGLAGWGGSSAWQTLLHDLTLRQVGSTVVPVAYADWCLASAPSVEEVCSFVCRSGTTLLIDTFGKASGATLLDYLTSREIAELCNMCRARGCKIALAGSLTLAHLGALKTVGADWFAVRGAACSQGQRGAPLSAIRIRELAEAIASGKPN